MGVGSLLRQEICLKAMRAGSEGLGRKKPTMVLLALQDGLHHCPTLVPLQWGLEVVIVGSKGPRPHPPCSDAQVGTWEKV